jgi:hypothetical protein
MPRNTLEPAAMPKLPPPLRFPYSTVERALAAAYGISDERRPAGFRSMISNLQKHGALGPQSRVGRGARLTYTPVEMHRLVLAIELSELAVPPATAAALLEAYWEPKLKPFVHEAARPIGLAHEEPPGNDIILFLGGVALRTDSLRGEIAPSVPNVDQCSLNELPVVMRRWMTAPNERGLIVNLSARLRAFHAALSDVVEADGKVERAVALRARKVAE